MRKILEGGRISNWQATALIITLILASSTISLPNIIYKEAGQDAWLSIIIAAASGIIAGFIFASLGNRFPRRTFIQYMPDIVGKTLGKIIGFIYIIFFMFINAGIIREIAEIFKTNFMQETPLSVFSIGMVLVAAYAVRSGLEVLTRVNEIMMPLVLLMLLMVMGLSYMEIDAYLLLPVLEDGFMPVLKGSIYPTLFFAETVVMLMIIPYLNKPYGVKRTIFSAILIVTLFQLALMVMAIGVFGSLVDDLNFPILQMARYISLLELFERMEPLIMLTWIGGGFVKVGIFYYCAVLAMAQWLNLREYKALVLPTGVLLVVLSIVLWENYVEFYHMGYKIVPPYFFALEIGLPLTLLVLAMLRGKGGVVKR